MGLEDSAIHALMVTFEMIMDNELADQLPEVPLTEDDEVVETLGPYRLHESLRMWIAAWTLGRNGHALDTARLEKYRPRLREEGVAIVDQVSRIAKESVHRTSTV